MQDVPSEQWSKARFPDLRMQLAQGKGFLLILDREKVLGEHPLATQCRSPLMLEECMLVVRHGKTARTASARLAAIRISIGVCHFGASDLRLSPGAHP